MIDSQGNEHLDLVNNIKYNDKLSCLVDRAIIDHSYTVVAQSIKHSIMSLYKHI